MKSDEGRVERTLLNVGLLALVHEKLLKLLLVGIVEL